MHVPQPHRVHETGVHTLLHTAAQSWSGSSTSQSLALSSLSCTISHPACTTATIPKVQPSFRGKGTRLLPANLSGKSVYFPLASFLETIAQESCQIAVLPSPSHKNRQKKKHKPKKLEASAQDGKCQTKWLKFNKIIGA